MISLSLISTAMLEKHICPYLVMSLVPGMDLLCTYQSRPMDRAQTRGSSSSCLLSSFPGMCLLLSSWCHLPSGICAMPWFWEEALWVKGQAKTKNSDDRETGADVPLGTSLGWGSLVSFLVQVGTISKSEHGGTWPVLIKRPAFFLQLPLNSKILYIVCDLTSRRSWMVKICCLCAANCSILNKTVHIIYRKLKWWWRSRSGFFCFSSYNMRPEGKNNTAIWTQNK